jgi:nicotinate-nucleotide pyrophosphorylase (carboxylating)
VKRLLGAFDAALPTPAVLDPILTRALEEDAAFTDRSTLPLPARNELRPARIVAREDGILAGVPVFRRVFELLAGEERVECTGGVDGDAFMRDDVVLTVVGPGGALLSGERTALNFLQRLSGIATRTRQAVQAAAGRVAVCDTRKTTPGLRALEKYAVVVGGGTSHRWSLDDMVMLKENHITLAGGVVEAIAAVRADPESSSRPLTVEVTTYDEALLAASQNVDRLLLDNMEPAEMRRIVVALGEARPELEASGGIELDDIARVAESGVDLVSLGSLTHRVRAVDLSFRLGEAT